MSLSPRSSTLRRVAAVGDLPALARLHALHSKERPNTPSEPIHYTQTKPVWEVFFSESDSEEETPIRITRVHMWRDNVEVGALPVTLTSKEPVLMPTKPTKRLPKPYLTPRRIVALAAFFVFFYIFNKVIMAFSLGKIRTECLKGFASSASIFESLGTPYPWVSSSRLSDTQDTFENYKYRDTCQISSLDLHVPFDPLCTDRSSMLMAMSSGGRIGHDAPYMPRGCDMRWFSTEEICRILSRFDKLIIVGDSMMRHIIGSLNVLIRKDLGYGAVTDWNFTPEERSECFCNFQFNVKACSMQGIFKTADVVKHDPESIACSPGSIDLMIEQMIRFPIALDEIERYKVLLGSTKPKKPYAFVFGHGLWNDLDLQATLDWLDQILEMTTEQLPYLKEKDSFWPRLFITPNAAGKEKPSEWIVSQGNKALMIFEESVKTQVELRGIEHLGTWNMSIQSNKFDGVHVDLKGNLIKAMMVLNWLNMLDVERH
ncbi:MAG: hypothetical protein M1829_005543 [Trizodia sp. TS-e1964]|nr:MAG: hypothetical protein M1829_005543 [Trizodia sp. TS-e1964]